MKPPDKEKLVEYNLTLADQLFRKLLPNVPKELLEFEITMAQLKILLLLFMGGPKRMSAIAGELDVTLPTATSLVDRLVEKGYLTRESLPADRRVVICRLSPTGEKAVNHIWKSTRARSRELLESLDSTKLKMFTEVFEAMLKEEKISARTLAKLLLKV